MNKFSPPHYYTDIVRRLFLTSAVMISLFLPVFDDRLPTPTFASLGAVIVLGYFAGALGPEKRLIIIINFIISITAFLIFEYQAVVVYKVYTTSDMLFWANQFLAMIFLAAIYFTTKSLKSLDP